jgi:hypothetical protein
MKQMSKRIYTFVFKKYPTFDEFRKASEACERVTSQMNCLSNWDGIGGPIFNETKVCFNNRGKTADTFLISTRTNVGSCDTRDLPYDLAVRCCLLIFSRFCPGFSLNDFDENEKKWIEAKEFCKDFLV